MESVGVVHELARETIGNDVRSAFEVAGPFASVYLDTSPDVENASQKVELRWRNAREDLAEQGAGESTLAAIDPLIADAHKSGGALAVIATDGGIVVAEHQPEPPKRDAVARWDTLPYVAPIIEWRQSSVPHVVVMTDRTGADIITVRRWGEERAFEVDASPNHDVTKAAPGGWSQARYQRRVENTWAENAQQVADAVADAADRTKAQLVVLGGDVRAVELLRDALPSRVADLITVIEGGRSPDGSQNEVADEVVRLAASAAAEETVALLQKFAEERGQLDRAADGVDETLAALTASKVETLLIHDDPDDVRIAFFDPDGTVIAAEAVQLRDFGVEHPTKGRLVDAAIRSAVLTGAGVWIIPGAGGPVDGTGAILRWSD